MQEKVAQNVQNSKLLVDALIKTCEEQLDDDKTYVLKIGFALTPQKLTDINKVKTMLNKFRAAISEFNDDIVIADLVLAVNIDTSDFDQQLVMRTHELLNGKVGVVTDAKEEVPSEVA